MVLGITYQHTTRRIYISFSDQRPTIILDVWGEDIKRTVEGFRKQVKGSVNQKNQDEFISCLADNWYKIIDLMNTIQGGNGDVDPDQGQNQSQAATAQTTIPTPSPIVPLSKAELVIAVAKDNIVKLFIDEYKEPHVAINVSDHLEILPLSSGRFRHWLSRILYKNEGEVIDSNVFSNALGILKAETIFDSGDTIKLNLRVAEGEDQDQSSCWYYDLTNKNWEFIKITSSGWDVIKNSIIFRRYNNQISQVYPDRNYESGIFDRFMKLVNIKADDKDSILLLKCYIISLFIPDIQKVVLILYGSQGAAKSSLQELIKMLVDPSIIKTLTFPRDANEFLQQLSHNYVAYYDNVSTIRGWISDLLCRAVSGSGSSKRQLYTDDDDIIRSFKRCIGLNGINLAATKPDLLDRSIITRLERIEDDKQRTPDEIWKEFEEIRPQLLSYIFDVLVKVLGYESNNPDKKFKLSRMTEFAKYGEIIARCVGYKDNEFIEAYKRNREIQTDEIIESSQVASCLMYMMYTKYDESNGDFRAEWDGTMSALLREFKAITDTDVGGLNIDTKNKYWPKNANVLRRRLNELAPTLKEAGLELTFYKTPDRNRTKKIKIRKIPSEPSEPSANEKSSSKAVKNADATADGNETLFKTSSANIDQNHAQNEDFGRSDDADDTLHI
jgi:hypothetical protein